MHRTLIVLCLSCLTIVAIGSDNAEIAALQKGAPKAVSNLIERIVTCNHFNGEEPYDAERAAFIDEALRKSRCDTVEADLAAARKNFSSNEKIIEKLNAASELFL